MSTVSLVSHDKQNRDPFVLRSTKINSTGACERLTSVLVAKQHELDLLLLLPTGP